MNIKKQKYLPADLMCEVRRELALYTKQAIAARCAELYSLASAAVAITHTNHQEHFS